MSEESEMTCAELADVAAELALGVLTGRERAEAVAHLDKCEACREDVRQLMATGDELLALLPASEPPAGFETRVLDRLGLEPAPPPRRPATGAGARAARRWHLTTRRMLATAAVLVAIVGAALGGWGVGQSQPASAHSELTAATFTSAAGPTSGKAVGQIWYYQGSPRWMYMAVEMAPGNGAVTCEVVGTDGRVTNIGTFRLADGYGSWGSPDPGTGALRGARLVAADGSVLATATFHG